jgi:hypothetical protein
VSVSTASVSLGTGGAVFLTGGNLSGFEVFTWLSWHAVRVLYENLL